MAGFTGVICKKGNIPENISFREKNVYGNEINYVQKEINSRFYKIEQYTSAKFLSDKVFAENDSFIVGIDGVVLNSEELRQEKETGFFETIIRLFTQYGKDFINKLRGDFCGFIYDKKENEWFVFTNHYNSKSVFYLDSSNYFIFSTELKEISHLMVELNIKKELDVTGAFLMLAYGYLLEDYTLVKNAKRLPAGNILTLAQDKVSVSEYFHLKNISQNTDSRTQIIEKMDQLFNEAIRSGFEKDKTNGYKHCATLSGGLDSRMTVLVAHKLGYKEQLNFTFSQSDHLDAKIAKQIADDYQHEFLFYPLDNGEHLKDIDKAAYCNDGLTIYASMTHMLKICEKIDHTQYGLIHTGMLGDAIIGSYLSKPYPTPATLTMGSCSGKAASEVIRFFPGIVEVFEKAKEKNPTEELFKTYNRGFLGILSGSPAFDIYSQSSSPFLNVDFLSYCFSIPETYKYGFKDNIYIDWIAAKHPEFAAYPWEKTGISPLKSNSYSKYFDINYYRRMSVKVFDLISKKANSGMHPFDRWFKTNIPLKSYLDNYFTQHILLLNAYPELQECTKQIYNSGNAMEKFIVLSLLAGIKLHFGNDK